uniref:Transmembrane protein n=1 Tax=Schlesneria paludicola TaxID=360056 RepID=A0A7C4LKG7_9PLAN
MRTAPAMGRFRLSSPVWLFGRTVDLSVFLGPAAAALLLVAVAQRQGWLDHETPEWTWVAGVLLVDVAHVYATAFRVYLLPSEWRRRPWLYGLTPALALVLGWAVASESEAWFWRLLAYLAVFHFVRQQYGWVAWYRARAGERDRWGAALDSLAIYLATIYPLAYWHAHLPRNFWWFLPGDFVGLPPALASCLAPLHGLALCAYALRSVLRGIGSGFWNPGKDLVVATTAACWYVGIVALNSDFAFTVTNVLIHGVPYLALTWRYARLTGQPSWQPRSPWAFGVLFLATVWLLAYGEELLWDRTIWHERGWLFGSARIEGNRSFWLALLAVPQITHYVLDGFIWRQSSNPQLRVLLEQQPVADPVAQLAVPRLSR